MATISKQRLTIAVGAPTLIFTACAIITISAVFKKYPDQLSIGLLIDMLLVAPLSYYLIIRNTTISKHTVVRVFTLGLFIATILLRSTHIPLLVFIKTWVAPTIELALVTWMIWKFKRAYQFAKTMQQTAPDFLIHCRTLLKTVFGSEQIGNIISSEVSVFYYLFAKAHKPTDNTNYFTSHKSNNILLLLYTFLFMFLVEAAIMHLLFQLWNHTAAWVLTGLSIYSCLQLLAHLRAIKARPTIVTLTEIMLRNGILGGDVIVSIDMIEHIEFSAKDIIKIDTVSMAFIKGIENHNVVIYLKKPISVTKAYGIKKTAKVILANIDEPNRFIEVIENYRSVY